MTTTTKVTGIRGYGVPADLPKGRHLHLRGRGTTFFREVPGSTDAPTVVLLHGWLATSALNWFQVFEPLGKHFRVLAPDLRGHGRGIKSRRRFRLTDCADDMAALIDKLGTGAVVAVGYSLGGPVAQLLWRRHPELVAGLVLCATGGVFVPGKRERFVYRSVMGALVATARLGQLSAQWPRFAIGRFIPGHQSDRPIQSTRWASAEMRGHDVRMVIEAAHSGTLYNARQWIREIDIPTAVLVTTEDRVMPASRQLEMARQIPNAKIYRLHEGHMLCASPAFARPLVRACREVAQRAFLAPGASDSQVSFGAQNSRGSAAQATRARGLASP